MRAAVEFSFGQFGDAHFPLGGDARRNEFKEHVPAIVDDMIGIRAQAYLALTFDHRLIDGALADQFTGRVKAILGSWSEEIV